VLRWNGTAWSVEAITYPGGAVPTEPGTVSCPSATTCTVLSVAGADTTPSPTVVARWDGSTWTGAASDATTPNAGLACSSSSTCVATGFEVTQRSVDGGATWSDMGLPGGTSPSEVFDAVSCATAEDCVAVGVGLAPGAPGQGPQRTPTVQRLDGDGVGWSAEDAGDRQLRYVSCATASSCMAAGSELGSFWTRHWDGDTWRDLPPVTDLRAFAVVGLSCAAPDWCVALTSRFSNGGDVAWVWTGGDAWTELATLPPTSGTATALSCPAPGDCLAATNWIGPLVFRLVGGAWTPVDTAGLGLDPLASVSEVDCAAPGECALVGDNGFVDHRFRALLAVWSGGTWSRTERTGVEAIDVDCWSAVGCVAVMSGEIAYLETWDGTRWQAVEGPPGLARPTSVSCGAPGRCEVTGSFVDGPDRTSIAAVTIDP
jgi:hypothetical protein